MVVVNYPFGKALRKDFRPGAERRGTRPGAARLNARATDGTRPPTPVRRRRDG